MFISRAVVSCGGRNTGYHQRPSSRAFVLSKAPLVPDVSNRRVQRRVWRPTCRIQEDPPAHGRLRLPDAVADPVGAGSDRRPDLVEALSQERIRPAWMQPIPPEWSCRWTRRQPIRRKWSGLRSGRGSSGVRGRWWSPARVRCTRRARPVATAVWRGCLPAALCHWSWRSPSGRWSRRTMRRR